MHTNQNSSSEEEANELFERFKPILIEDLLKIKFVEPQWIVDKLVPFGGITLLTGDPASYKTWITLLLALAVSDGSNWLGQFKTTKTSVLVVEEEVGYQLMSPRVKMLAGDRFPTVYLLSRRGFMLVPKDITEVVEICIEKNVALVILDPFVRMSPAKDENSATQIAEIFRSLQQFTTNGITVILTHHNRKQLAGSPDSPSSPRGSSDIVAAVDSHLSLKKRDDIIMVSQLKSRHGKEIQPFKIQVKEEIQGESKNLKFELLGQISAPSKNVALKELILSTIAQSEKKFNKNQLYLELTKDGNKIPRNRYLELVDELIKAKIVSEEKGLKNSIILGLVSPPPAV